MSARLIMWAGEESITIDDARPIDIAVYWDGPDTVRYSPAALGQVVADDPSPYRVHATYHTPSGDMETLDADLDTFEAYFDPLPLPGRSAPSRPSFRYDISICDHTAALHELSRQLVDEQDPRYLQ